MKRVILFMISVLLAATTVAQEQITVKIDKKQRWQRIEGWGSSLCWWAHMCGRWDEEKVDKLLDLITSKDGLNMKLLLKMVLGYLFTNLTICTAAMFMKNMMFVSMHHGGVNTTAKKIIGTEINMYIKTITK